MADYGFTHGKVVDAGGGGASGIVKFIGLAFIAILMLIFVFSSFTTIHTGHVGVLTLYGEVTGQVLEAGLHFVNPLKSVHEISIQTSEIKETASVPSSEGLVMGLDTSLILHLDAAHAASIIKDVTPPYEDTLVEPNLRS